MQSIKYILFQIKVMTTTEDFNLWIVGNKIQCTADIIMNEKELIASTGVMIINIP
jgi:hypothetical protein